MSRPSFNRITWLQILTIVALLVPLLGVCLYGWTHHQRIANHLVDLEPKYARLAGLLEHKAELQEMGAQVRSQLEILAYPASQDVARAGNDAQQRIRSLFVESKLDIISIQVLPPLKEESKFDRIPINLRVEGDVNGIHNALSMLAAQSPVVFVESISLQVVGVVRPASVQRLAGQFNFFVLRARS
jgi:general secretion pathway protein M